MGDAGLVELARRFVELSDELETARPVEFSRKQAGKSFRAARPAGASRRGTGRSREGGRQIAPGESGNGSDREGDVSAAQHDDVAVEEASPAGRDRRRRAGRMALTGAGIEAEETADLVTPVPVVSSPWVRCISSYGVRTELGLSRFG